MTGVTKFDVKITLTVSAKYLYETANPTPADVEKLCLLSDDHNGNHFPNPDDAPATNGNFISDVFKSKNVKWTGKSIDPSYVIRIDDFVVKSEEEPPVESAVIDIDSKTTLGLSVAYKVKDSISAGVAEDYTIEFTITKAGNSKSFSLDPKIRPNN